MPRNVKLNLLSLHSIFLGEQSFFFFFIYCFLCICSFMEFVHSLFSQQNSNSAVKGKWNIFLQFLMMDASSQCRPLERSFHKMC